MSLYKRGKVWWTRIAVNKEVYQFSTGTGNKNEARNVEAEFRTSKQGVKGVPTSNTTRTIYSHCSGLLWQNYCSIRSMPTLSTAS